MTKLTVDTHPPDPPDRSAREPREPSKRHAAKAPAPARAPSRRTPTERGLEPGAEVRVTSGPFEGKTGVIQQIVGRRSARVMLGLLPVQIDLDDLAPGALNGSARARPRLTSSHKKPSLGSRARARS